MMNRIQRFLWRLWVAVSGIWILLLIIVGSWGEMRTYRGDLLIAWPSYWVIIIGPPLLLLLIGLLFVWIFSALSSERKSIR